MKPLNRHVLGNIVFMFVLLIPLHAYGSELINAAAKGDASTVRSLTNQGVNVGYVHALGQAAGVGDQAAPCGCERSNSRL